VTVVKRFSCDFLAILFSFSSRFLAVTY